MRVPGMTALQARAFYRKGISSAEVRELPRRLSTRAAFLIPSPISILTLAVG